MTPRACVDCGRSVGRSNSPRCGRCRSRRRRDATAVRTTEWRARTEPGSRSPQSAIRPPPGPDLARLPPPFEPTAAEPETVLAPAPDPEPPPPPAPVAQRFVSKPTYPPPTPRGTPRLNYRRLSTDDLEERILNPGTPLWMGSACRRELGRRMKLGPGSPLALTSEEKAYVAILLSSH